MGGYNQQILDALQFVGNLQKGRQEQGLQQQQLDLQRQATEALRNIQQEQLKLEGQRLKTEQAHQEWQDIIQGAPLGITPPGATVTPGLTPTAAQPLVLSGLEQNQVTMPSGNTYSIPTPQQLAERQAANLRITQAPAEEFKIAEQAKQQQAETARQLQTLAVEHLNRMAEQQQAQDAASRLEDKRGSIQLQVARINATGGFTDFANSSSVAQAISQGMIGKLSREDLRGQFTPKQMPQVQNAAAEQGVTFLPKATTNQLLATEQILPILPKIEEMLTLRATSPIAILNPFSTEGERYDSLAKDIRAAAPQASVALSGVRRFSNPELERFDDYFTPSKMPTNAAIQANIAKFNDFKKDLQTTVDRLTRGLSPAQTDTIWDNFTSQGLVRPQKQTGQPAQQPTQGQPIQGSPTKPSPFTYIPKPGMITVKSKKTGQVYYIPQRDFNPSTMEEYK